MSADLDDDFFTRRLLTIGVGAVCLLVLWKDLRAWVLRQLYGQHLDSVRGGAAERRKGGLPAVSEEVVRIREELGAKWEGWVEHLQDNRINSWAEVLSLEEGDLLNAADAFLRQQQTHPVALAKAKAALRDWHRRKGDVSAPASPPVPPPSEGEERPDPPTQEPPAPPPPAAVPPAASDAEVVEEETVPAEGGEATVGEVKEDKMDEMLEDILDDMDAEENVVDQAWDKVTDMGPRALSTETGANPLFEMVNKSVKEITKGLHEAQKRKESEKRARETELKKLGMKVQSIKLRGNDAFKAGRYEESLELYTQAIDMDTSHLSPELHSNRAAVYSKLGRIEEALKDAERCIELCPQFPKGWSRKAEALESLERWGEAKAVWTDVKARFVDLPWKEDVDRHIEKCANEEAAADLMASDDD